MVFLFLDKARRECLIQMNTQRYGKRFSAYFKSEDLVFLKPPFYCLNVRFTGASRNCLVQCVLQEDGLKAFLFGLVSERFIEGLQVEILSKSVFAAFIVNRLLCEMSLFFSEKEIKWTKYEDWTLAITLLSVYYFIR